MAPEKQEKKEVVNMDLYRQLIEYKTCVKVAKALGYETLFDAMAALVKNKG